MFLGTGSDVGKSITTTAFCRILKNRGLKVAPFKAQNMSNNSFVTLEGGEIGRAQAAQAEAACLLPSVRMNPILLKPSSDRGAQIILHGKVYKNLEAREYYVSKDRLKAEVLKSFQRLSAEYEAIVLEGAGSCCEVNLRKHDIVNFEMALQVKAPVIIVADIDRGGVFAQIIGSLALISPEERELVAGFIINKFRGDPSLFDDGIAYIEKETGKPVFGLVPHYSGIHIDREDSMSLDLAETRAEKRERPIRIAAIRLAHISNFTDLEVLALEPEIALTWLERPASLIHYDAVIIPGSKSVIHDMERLKALGWPQVLQAYAEKGHGIIVGLCGGFQILGREIRDPLGIEGKGKSITGLGLLDVSTEIEETKIVKHSEGKDRLFSARVHGYEIHMGRTILGPEATPLLDLEENTDGAMSADGKVLGTYLHGLFDTGEFRQRFLRRLAAAKGIPFNDRFERQDFWLVKDKNYNLLAEHFEHYTDVTKVMKVMEGCSL